MADVAVAPFVRQFANVDFEWFESAAGVALKRWLARFVVSELFLAVMQKYPRWLPENDVLVFGADSTTVKLENGPIRHIDPGLAQFGPLVFVIRFQARKQFVESPAMVRVKGMAKFV